jgi:hypothetical protein
LNVGDWRIPRAAVIPTNGRECVNQCLDAILPQVDFAVVVETDPAVAVPARERVHKFWDEGDVNISRWWGHGLDLVEWRMERETNYLPSDRRRWDVAILNDDAIVCPNWFDGVAGKMREMKAVAASNCDHTQMPILYTKPGPVDLFQRMQGFAFILCGEAGVEPNERYSWYCSDDHMDWTARELGGVVVLPGFPVQHLYPNGQVTAQIQEQIAKDMANFVDDWGQRPW